MVKIIGIVAFALLLLATSCDREKLDTKEFAKELKSKKIKRVTEGEIIANAQKLGDILSDTLNLLFDQQKCELQRLPVVQTFIKEFDAKVNIYSDRDTSTMDSLTKQVFQATSYGIGINATEARKPNLQNLKNEYWLYSRPLKLGQCGIKEFTLLCIVISQAEMIKKLN